MPGQRILNGLNEAHISPSAIKDIRPVPNACGLR